MSNIPLRFRDWWDEYDVDFDSLMHRRPRTSRLLDQHFGTSFRRNDLLNSLANTHIGAVSKVPYFRPYSLARQDSGSTVNVQNDKFEVLLDVQQFTPDEIAVKTSDKFIIIEGKHEEKQDEHGYVSRHFVRKYMLPANYKQEDVTSSLSSDGILTISASAPPAIKSGTDELRSVPIQPVGPKKESIQTGTKSDDQQNSSSPKIEQLN